MTNGAEVVVQAHKIQTLLQLATYLKAAELPPRDTGTQTQLQLMDRQRTTLWINSKLIQEVLTAEYNKLGEELTAAGIDLDDLLEGEKARFTSFYQQQSN